MQTTNKNIEIVKQFKKKAGKIVDLEKIIFFGSRFKGTYDENSDFDLIVISNDFKNKPFYKRPIELHLNWQKNYPLELICYTPTELKQKLQNPFSIAAEAVRTGITI